MITAIRYSIEDLREEAQQLVQQGRLSRQNRIYNLYGFLPRSQWEYIESELERNDFLLRDRLIDLLDNQVWRND